MPEKFKSDIIEFKYTWNDKGEVISEFKSGSGSFDGSILKIGNIDIPVTDILSMSVDDHEFYFGIADDDNGTLPIIVEFYGTDVIQLEHAINASRSSALAGSERDRLTQSGKLANYRDHVCPFCKSTIVLTNLPPTPQVYCNFCDTLFSVDQEPGDEIERDFRICENCGMYSRPRKFAVFYFYFLIVTFGFHHDSIVRCSGCMRSSAWKMVLGNLFGLLGFPFALVQLYRSYSTKSLTGRFEGLDTANVLARRGNVDKALQRYDEIMDRVPENAGVKYNIGFGLMLKKDFGHAQEIFELSLDDCSNYWPAVNGLLRALQQQGKSDQIEAVYRVWGSRPQ